MKKLKENVHIIQVGCQLCGGAHLDKECPLNEEVKSVEEVKYGDFRRSSPFNNGPKYRVGPPGYNVHVDNRLPFREKRPSLEELISKHLEESTRRRAEMEEWLTKEFHTKAASEVPNSSVGQCKAVYANDEAPINNTSSNGTNKLYGVSFISNIDERVAQEEEDLGASVNVIPKSMFERLKLANLKKIDMLVEMVAMTKRAPMGIVENVLVKIDKFLFPSDFMVIDMLNTHNETMILKRPFLATIHAEINVFNKDISLGIGDDKVTFDMDKRIHNFTNPVGKVYMVNSIRNDEPSTISNAPLDKSPQFEESNNLHHQNSNDNYMQERSSKKARMLKPDTNTQACIFATLSSKSEMKYSRINQGGRFSLGQPVDHNNISDSVKKALLKLWLIDCFKGEVGPAKDPRARIFDDYKWVLDLEIDKLTDEYELRIGKKGYMLEDIWEYCEKVQGDNTNWWHDHGFEEDERQESGLDKEEYDLPKVHVETFKVNRYSFDSGYSFIYVTKEIEDTLPLGRETDQGSEK
ncbi:reverse transcriptase domain-containing protein [Tanacetum coccineum]